MDRSGGSKLLRFFKVDFVPPPYQPKKKVPTKKVRTKFSSVHAFEKSLKDLQSRDTRKLIIDGEDFTPKHLRSPSEGVRFQNLIDTVSNILYASTSKDQGVDDLSSRLSFSTGMNVTMDDIGAQIALGITLSDEAPFFRQHSEEEEDIKKPPKMPPFIKVVLRETDDILLFEKSSVTVAKDSEEAAQVEEDNKMYDYLTIGKGRNRRRADAETQTVDILYKSRHVNTERIKKLDIGTYVSNYDMFDTYADLQSSTKSIETDDGQEKLEVTTYTHRGINEFEKINSSSNFKLAIMLMQRLLAGNVYREKQKRFRNMYIPNPLSDNIKYMYRLDELWSYSTVDVAGMAVSSLSWCTANGDILAAAYGVYSFVPHVDRMIGYVCIWSIKNPVNPERKYRYSVPVTAVSFSKKTPQLLAVGLYNGSVEIRDITDEAGTPVAISQRSTSPGSETVVQIEWIPVQGNDGSLKEELLTISQDGTIMKYSMTAGPYLLGFQQMKLDRVEGLVEGLQVVRNQNFIEADRRPRPLTLKIHPFKVDTYYVGTDEGCLHKCSTNYPHQHLEVLQVHNGGVFAMEFSPWSPKIFLTCGEDWCIRIWAEGVFQPLIYLSSGIGPVHCAYWSPINSTIIIGVTRTAVEVWDIRRSTLKPVSSKKFESESESESESENTPLTLARFSNCGRSLVVGNDDGKMHMCALEDMPFPPHFPYEQLESSIYKALIANPELTQQVQSLGYLGNKEESKNEIVNKMFSQK